METEKIRVLLADDHSIVREGVAQVLNRQPGMAVVAEAVDGAHAVELYGRYHPDVTIVDLRMPALDGIEVVHRIRATAPDAVIVVLTTFDADDDIARALEAGAKGYLLKDVSPHDLASCVRAVHAGRMWVSPGIAAKLATRVQFTPREMAVLRLLVAGKANSDIADSLAIAEGTVKTHVAHLLNKLDASNRTEAIATAVRRGLVRIG